MCRVPGRGRDTGLPWMVCCAGLLFGKQVEPMGVGTVDGNRADLPSPHPNLWTVLTVHPAVGLSSPQVHSELGLGFLLAGEARRHSGPWPREPRSG